MSSPHPYQLCSFFLIQRSDRLIKDRFECCIVGDGEVREDFSINFNLRRSQSFDESTVGRAMLAARCINSLNPETPEISLPCFAITIGPRLSLHRCVFGVSEKL